MKGGQKSYQFPRETLPSLELSHHLADLVEMRNFLIDRGIQTRNTRIDRYIAYLQQACSQDPNDASEVFKNSVHGPFRHQTDWLLYVLREVHELAWIHKGLNVYLPSGIDDKLRVVVAGSDFAALDADSQSRNIQFELRIASYFCQAGCEVRLSQETDIIALARNQAFYIECKRVRSEGQLSKRLTEARKQLHNRMPREHGKRDVYGCVAADVTKVAFTHNGLTLGLTNEHSRDVVQKKLINIAEAAQTLPLFRDCKSLLFYWLQIHIPSLILQPPTPVTRFSSYHILREGLARKERRAATVFYGIFESVSKSRDERETPPEEIRIRRTVKIPAGATFSLDDDLLGELLQQGEVRDRNDNEIVGTLSMNGANYDFSFLEFKMLPESLIKDWRNILSEGHVKARLQLIMEMYLQRFPCEESECDRPQA